MTLLRKISHLTPTNMRKRYHKFNYRRTKVQSHKIIAETVLAGGSVVTQIAEEENLEVFRGHSDTGYHNFGTKWWTNPACPFSYKYLSLDSELYPEQYFGSSIGGHPDYTRSKQLYDYMQRVYALIFGSNFNSILELGTGGGEISVHFHEAGLDLVAVEGTTSGVNKLRGLGIAEDQIVFANLKFMKPLNRKFDLVMCTEVAEHLEPWFASKIVSNCVEHGDVIWFSAARGDAMPHYHHINEVPIEAWDNIFAHFGFGYYVALNQTQGRADRLYFNKAKFDTIQH